MQNSFADAADMGKVYINYPMIESFQHLKAVPDSEFAERKIAVSLQPGSKYKELKKAITDNRQKTLKYQLKDRIYK